MLQHNKQFILDSSILKLLAPQTFHPDVPIGRQRNNYRQKAICVNMKQRTNETKRSE